MFVNLYTLVLLVYAVVSWIPDIRGPWVRYVSMLVEPILNPLRRVIPPTGGLDLAFLVLILALNFVLRPYLADAARHLCFG